MCGGGMEAIPCSHVGHVYRKSMIWRDKLVKEEISNYYRVAEVWMDEYKHMVFERSGNYTVSKTCYHIHTKDMFNFAYVINSKCNKSYLPGV